MVAADRPDNSAYRVFHYAMLLVLAGAVAVTATAIALGVRYWFRPDHVHSKVQSVSDRAIVFRASSTLTRTNGAAQYDFKTLGLPGGHAVTLRAEIFNYPEQCTHAAPGMRCGPEDLTNPAVAGSTVILTTRVTRPGSLVEFAGAIPITAATGTVKSGPGITNLDGAEFHLVLADSCPGEAAPAILTGTSTCVDVQYSVHQP